MSSRDVAIQNLVLPLCGVWDEGDWGLGRWVLVVLDVVGSEKEGGGQPVARNVERTDECLRQAFACNQRRSYSPGGMGSV